MSRATKALLLSALIFPGLGHLYLRSFIKGLLLLGFSAAGLFYIGQLYMVKIEPIMQQILSGEMALDPVVFLINLEHSISRQERLYLNIASWTVVIAWLLGMFDSYRQGGKINVQKKAASVSERPIEF
jgi:hypothetical protein